MDSPAGRPIEACVSRSSSRVSRARVRLAIRGRRITGMAMILLLIAPRAASGQANPLPDDFVNPILVLNGQGHTAPLRRWRSARTGNTCSRAERTGSSMCGNFGRGSHGSSGHPSADAARCGLVYAVDVSPVPDQRLVAVAGHSVVGGAGQILVYRLPAPNHPGTIELAFVLPDRIKNPDADPRGHQGEVFGLSFSPDGHYLASCGQDCTIRIWDVLDEKHVQVCILAGDPTGDKGHAGAVLCVAFVGGDRLVSAGGSSMVRSASGIGGANSLC